jgi:hypothetical protein
MGATSFYQPTNVFNPNANAANYDSYNNNPVGSEPAAYYEDVNYSQTASYNSNSYGGDAGSNAYNANAYSPNGTYISNAYGAASVASPRKSSFGTLSSGSSNTFSYEDSYAASKRKD